MSILVLRVDVNIMHLQNSNVKAIFKTYTCKFVSNMFHVYKFMFRQLFGGRTTYRVSVTLKV